MLPWDKANYREPIRIVRVGDVIPGYDWREHKDEDTGKTYKYIGPWDNVDLDIERWKQSNGKKYKYGL